MGFTPRDSVLLAWGGAQASVFSKSVSGTSNAAIVGDHRELQGMLRKVEVLGVFADHKESRGFWKGARSKVGRWDNLSTFS